MKYSCIRQTR